VQQIRLVILAVTGCALAMLVMAPLRAQELSTVKLNMFSARRETTLGSDLGFFAARGLRLELSLTTSSEQQAQELLDGVWDITGADADNYVYWTQDHGADFFIFMVGEGTIDNHLWVRREITSFEDLRGQVIAADSAFSGQTSMVRMMMQAHGLEYGRDYTFLPVGSGRLPCVLDGSAAGASAGSATAASEAAQNGDVHVLARGPI
jgi:ABC-type nitrate/sulfonate/bicarbonate transport system substrate-binding protein